MAEQRDTPVMIIAVDDDLDGLKSESEKFGSKVTWVTVSQEFLDQILEFVRHPETGVRAGRPKRKGVPGDEEEL